MSTISKQSLDEQHLRAMADSLFTTEVFAHINGVMQDRVANLRTTDFHEVTSWTHLFNSTTGPFGGIGGAAITAYRITVISNKTLALAFANGRYLGAAKLTGWPDRDAIDKARIDGEFEDFERPPARLGA